MEDPEDIFQAEIFVDKSYSVEEVDVGGVTVQLEALHSSSSTDFDLTGQVVWPASRLLSLYLVTCGLEVCDVERILEVGAGVGLAGLIAAKVLSSPDVTHQSEIILTDNQDEVLQILQRNVELNSKENAQVRIDCAHLSWGLDVDKFSEQFGVFDVIIGADVVFWPAAVPLLFETAAALLSEKAASRMIISYISRSNYSTKLMYECAARYGFTWDILDLHSDPIYAEFLEEQAKCGRQANLVIFRKIRN